MQIFHGSRSVNTLLRAPTTTPSPIVTPGAMNTSAAIHTNGLFGSKFIVLEPGGEFDELTDGDSITYTQDSLVVEDLLELIITEGKARRAAAEAN